MGKKIVIIAFLSIFSYALYYALNTDLLNLSSVERNSESIPRLVLEKFSIKKFNENKLVSNLKGEVATFNDPNILKISEGLVLDNYENDSKIKALSATTYFNSENISDLSENGRLLGLYLKEV